MKFLVFPLIIFLFSHLHINAETKRATSEDNTKNWEIEFGLTNYNAGSFNDYNGNRVSENPRIYLIDTSGIKKDTIKGRYNFNYSSNIYNLKINYLLSPKLSFSIYLPISNYSLEEKGSFNYKYITTDQNGNKFLNESEKKIDSTPIFSTTQIEYLAFSTKYTIIGEELTTTIKLDISTDFRLPLGKNKFINRFDSINGFVYDGSLEILFSPNLVLNFQDFNFNSKLIYMYRNEDLRDLLFLNNKLSLTKDPNFNLSFILNLLYCPSNNFTNEEKQFYPRFTPTYEEYINIGAEVKIKLSPLFSFNSGFLVRAYSSHSWNSSTLYLNSILSF